ncbi:hypothetical protein G6O67_001441 [Ophiocordyceps sinensis]|uniref:Cell cycle control protein n=3 Tax=Ophiocordyceps sinensis TaxID=72228 RepID=A0A8H4PXB5_9HYPO|nr:hypothetical protein G6O67_001441 [Ophiocordyceps sinensis]
MARAGGEWLDMSSDDDLVEIQINPPRRRPNNLDSLLNPPGRAFTPAQQPALAPNRPSDGRSTPWDRPPTPAPAPVIDLTEAPDSPVQQWQQWPEQYQGARNPRRTNSLRVSPPRLARSNTTLFAPVASIIDLTDESPQVAPLRPYRLRSNHSPPHQQAPARHPRPNYGTDHLIELELINGGPSFFHHFSRGVQQHMASILHSDIVRANFNAPQLDFTGPFSPRQRSPKPPMEAVPPTRDGFTRDTCSDTCPESKNDDERVVICPACNEELAYDPTDTSPPGSTAGGRKRKRAAGQHHFWALKKCGHVYCADCFENRRPTKAAPAGVGFQSPTGKPPVTVPTDLRCAVEGCETKVATKTEWIGIFL